MDPRAYVLLGLLITFGVILAVVPTIMDRLLRTASRPGVVTGYGRNAGRTVRITAESMRAGHLGDRPSMDGSRRPIHVPAPTKEQRTKHQ